MNEKKRAGVIVAIEVDSVLAEYGEAKYTENLCGFSLRQYDSEQCTLFVLSSGAGEIAAAAATQLLIDHCKVDILVNFGVVGALSAEMATAERCVVRRVVHYDFDTRAWLGLPVGQYPGYETPYVSADKALLQKALAADPALRPSPAPRRISLWTARRTSSASTTPLRPTSAIWSRRAFSLRRSAAACPAC